MMKKTLLFASMTVLVGNILAGLLLTDYHTFNVVATCVVVVLTTTLVYIAENITLKDAFRVSLSFIFTALGVIMFLLMIFAKHQIQDNWHVIVSLVIMIVELTILYVTLYVSKKNR